MTIGFHTDAFNSAYWSFDQCLEWAQRQGVRCVECGLSIECEGQGGPMIEKSLAWLRPTMADLHINEPKPGVSAAAVPKPVCP